MKKFYYLDARLGGIQVAGVLLKATHQFENGHHFSGEEMVLSMCSIEENQYWNIFLKNVLMLFNTT